MKYLALILIALLAACSAQKQDTGAKELAEQLREQAMIENAPQAQQDSQEEPEQEQNSKDANATQEPAIAAQTAPAQPETAQPSEPIQAEPQKTQESEQITAVEIPEETAPAEKTPLYDFLDTFAKKVTGYQFNHKGDRYLVKGTKLKIILDQPRIARDIKLNGTKYSLFYYDTVYLDRAAKSAIAYCEGTETELNRQCTQMKLQDIPYLVPFSEFSILLPEDWLFSYLDLNPVRIDRDKYIVSGRAAHSYTFRQGDDSTELFFDETTGLPVRADQTKYGRLISRYDYELLSANKVRDVDVRHRSLSEIPSEEYFYKR